MKGRVPKRISTDKRQEHRAKEENVLNDFGFTHLYAQNETKSDVAEPAIKAMKTGLYCFMTYKQSYKYIDKLPMFSES